MSSYFDEASRQHYQLEQEGKTQEAEDLVEKVINRYGSYLVYILNHALKAEIPRVQVFIDKLVHINQNRTRWTIEDIHNLAHEVGSARIALKGKRFALDNPYFKDNVGIP